MESLPTDHSSVGWKPVVVLFAPDEEAVDGPGRTLGVVACCYRRQPRLGPALTHTEADERVLVFGITIETTRSKQRSLRFVYNVEAEHLTIWANDGLHMPH